MLEYIASATLMALAGGFGPGPLMTLVVGESLSHGFTAGLRVAIAPALTDAPIIAVSLLLLSRLDVNGWILGAISLVGGLVVFRMGYVDLRHGAREVDAGSEAPDSLRKGIVVNLLNPHPYIFWFGVGGPITVRAAAEGLHVAVAFVAVFYAILVGSKVVIAWVAATSRRVLRGRAYDISMRVLGALLCLFALLLIRDGVSLIRNGIS